MVRSHDGRPDERNVRAVPRLKKCRVAPSTCGPPDTQVEREALLFRYNDVLLLPKAIGSHPRYAAHERRDKPADAPAAQHQG